MSDARYIVGVDLGTTHSVVAVASLLEPRLHLLRVPQLSAPGEVSERQLLPSFLYLPVEGELSASDRQLPWGAQGHIVGEYARKQGSRNPNGLVASAKSWICHGGVNRRAAILPWSAPDTLQHVSPYEAQVAYLSHLAAAWALDHPGIPLAEQDVVVTVPASFDESARILTSDAAKEAGLGEVRLLEEPQAAFYDYLGTSLEGGSEEQSHKCSKKLAELSAARLILVVDVGGGTTDLTLLRVVQAEDKDGGALPTIERIAVFGHLMLGGDNMDAALAFYCIQKASIPQPDDATVWARLVQSARDAKERLLAADAPAEAVVSYQGRGSGLIGNTKSIVITRDEAVRVLLDGCFPFTGPKDVAQRSVARSGLTTLGLPYTTDTAVPRHICSFLRRHAAAATEAGASSTDGLPRPDLLLLNGGVFEAPAIVARLLEVLTRWYDGNPPRLLEHISLHASVARGAARFGLALRGVGSVIRGGSARGYYIGIEHQGNRRALCIAPRNLELGTRVSVPNQLFELRLNEPVQFPLYTCTLDRVDPAGALVDVEGGDDLEALPPLETLLRGQKDAKYRETVVSVSVEAFLDEGGNLRLALVSAELPPRRWTLDFLVRASDSHESEKAHGPSSGSLVSGNGQATSNAAEREPESEREPPHREAGPASHLIRSTFASTQGAAGELRQKLEAQLGPRGQWSSSTCRVLADACLAVISQRKSNPLHELTWLRLLSWTLRPGFGKAGDSARLDSLWNIEQEGPAFPTKTNWGEWWILWRRVAPGLSSERQRTLFGRVEPWFWPEGRPRTPLPLGPIEAMRMLAALERLPPAEKARAGTRFLEQAQKLGSYWPLGRVGARVLFHGPADCIVAKDQAELWLQHLLDLDWPKSAGAAFAAASLARVTGEAARDVRPELRAQVVERLTEIAANSTWVDMVLRPVHLDQSDLARVLGDSLPSGLRLG